jgi:hypothetical protein
MKYNLALIVSGIGWFCVAAVLGRGIPIIGEMWLQHLISAVITSLVIGFFFKKAVMTWRGWRRYILPLLTLLSATTLFGVLVPLSWQVTSRLQGRGDVDGQAFYQVPVFMVFYSMTAYLLILYPLALLTQNLLRKLSATSRVNA